MKDLHVIITGAGSVLPWGLPSTNDLTNLLCEDNVFINESNDSIGKFILKILKFGNKNSRTHFHDPNFESILHFIEELFEYKTSTSQAPYSLYKLANHFKLNRSIENQLIFFEKNNPNFKNNNYLITALGKRNCLLNEWFYWELYLHFITLINNMLQQKIQIFTKNYIINTCPLNEKFNLFLKSIKDNNEVIRYYTTNYDNLPLIISKTHLSTGYDKSTGYINLKKVYDSSSLDCYYQLHGSLNLNLHGQISEDFNTCRVIRGFSGNSLIPSNIIAGYNKLDRLFQEPYFHFYNKLVEDCRRSTKITIIGYSFGDVHINAAISNALKFRNKKLILVDKSKFSEYVWRYTQINPSKEYYLPESITNSTSKSNNYFETENVKVFLNGFEQFLESYK